MIWSFIPCNFPNPGVALFFYTVMGFLNSESTDNYRQIGHGPECFLQCRLEYATPPHFSNEGSSCLYCCPKSCTLYNQCALFTVGESDFYLPHKSDTAPTTLSLANTGRSIYLLLNLFPLSISLWFKTTLQWSIEPEYIYLYSQEARLGSEQLSPLDLHWSEYTQSFLYPYLTLFFLYRKWWSMRYFIKIV
jgi:hypothetical protein